MQNFLHLRKIITLMEAYVIAITDDGVFRVQEKAYKTEEEANAALNKILEPFEEDITCDEVGWHTNQLRVVCTEGEDFSDSYEIYRISI